MKRYNFLILAFVLIASLAACSQQAETIISSRNEPNDHLPINEPVGQSLASFSYAEDAATYQDGDPGVNPNEFVNVDIYPIENQDTAVERAKTNVRSTITQQADTMMIMLICGVSIFLQLHTARMACGPLWGIAKAYI